MIARALSAGESEGVWRLAFQDKDHLVYCAPQSRILLVPGLHVDSAVVFSSICLQFREVREQGPP